MAFADSKATGIWHRKARGAAVLAAMLLLSACQTFDFYSEQVDKQPDNTAFRPSTDPVTAERVLRGNRWAKIARSQHGRILATYGGEYSDPKLERMVAKIVGGLTTVGGNNDQAYQITILDSPQVNAFALPGGYLYVTRGLLALANDSAEVAAVLAHEMGHVTANHGIARQQLEQEAEAASKVARELFPTTTVAEETALRGKLRVAQFSRNQELEADAVGIRAIGQAGFDPFASSRFLAAMAAYGKLRSVSGATDESLDFLASHPNVPQRIQMAEGHARQFGPPGSGARDRDAFLAGIDGLLFGDTPDEGYVRGNTFMHPKLGVAFSVPSTFVIDNSAAAVTANGPGDTAVRFDGVELKSGQTLMNYVTSGWVTGLDPSSVQQTTINGSEAVTARAAADNWKFDVTVIRVGQQAYRLLTAAPATSSGLDAVAGSVRNSFRTLSAAEKTALKPLRIRIISARSGDTISTLANRMVGVGRKEELFRVLNELQPGAQVPAGYKVKIVTDR